MTHNPLTPTRSDPILPPVASIYLLSNDTAIGSSTSGCDSSVKAETPPEASSCPSWEGMAKS